MLYYSQHVFIYFITTIIIHNIKVTWKVGTLHSHLEPIACHYHTPMCIIFYYNKDIKISRTSLRPSVNIIYSKCPLEIISRPVLYAYSPNEKQYLHNCSKILVSLSLMVFNIIYYTR